MVSLCLVVAQDLVQGLDKVTGAGKGLAEREKWKQATLPAQLGILRLVGLLRQ
jgi:hypothetical protein